MRRERGRVLSESHEEVLSKSHEEAVTESRGKGEAVLSGYGGGLTGCPQPHQLSSHLLDQSSERREETTEEQFKWPLPPPIPLLPSLPHTLSSAEHGRGGLPRSAAAALRGWSGSRAAPAEVESLWSHRRARREAGGI